MRFGLVSACFILLNFLSPFTSPAQPTDFQTWGTLTIKKSFSKKLDGAFEQELRLIQTPFQLNNTFSDIYVKYELLDNFSTELHFRYIIRPEAESYRPYIDFSYDIKFDKWTLEPRLRFQHEIMQNELAENYVRPKATLSYKINKKWEPYTGAEVFYRTFYYKGNHFDEYRLSAGIAYDINKEQTIKVYYLYDQEFNVAPPERSHVAGVAYKYSFK